MRIHQNPSDSISRAIATDRALPLRARQRPRAGQGIGVHGALIRCALLMLAALLIGTAAGCDGDAESGASSSRAPRSAPTIGAVADSLAGRYRIEVRPATPPVVLGEIHDWVIRLERTDGRPAQPVSVSFDGGMPAHGHGFTTAPRVARSLGDGEFLVKGVRFHMGGEWQLRVALTDAEGSDGAALAFTPDP
jgi:hypothetical protein